MSRYEFHLHFLAPKSMLALVLALSTSSPGRKHRCKRRTRVLFFLCRPCAGAYACVLHVLACLALMLSPLLTCEDQAQQMPNHRRTSYERFSHLKVTIATLQRARDNLNEHAKIQPSCKNRRERIQGHLK